MKKNKDEALNKGTFKAPFRFGFTLIELLVVVLIIGVLAAIALPMYQKAVLKSRFAALMPIVKSMSDSNEAYYLEHGNYATNPQDLPVQGQLEYPDGTELEFGSNIEYAYVLATNPDARNNYVMYQKHSVNYPGEIHCEAVTGDELAESICASFGNAEGIGTTLTDGYTTYIIDGSGAGLPADAEDALDETEDPVDPYSCDNAIALGYTCTADETKGTKKVCVTLGDSTYCRFKTFDEEGGYISQTCKVNTSNKCVAREQTTTMYDKDGNAIWNYFCTSFHNIAGNDYCYASQYWRIYAYEYDDEGRLVATRLCNSSSNNDNSGAKMSSYVNADGSCKNGFATNTNGADSYFYSYDDETGARTARRCYKLNSDGTCQQFQDSNVGVTVTLSDENGNTKVRYCNSVNSSGSCSSYGYSSAMVSYGLDFQQDPTTGGRFTKYCKALNSDGVTCKTYDKTYASLQFYDEQGNLIKESTCVPSADFSTCSTYKTTNIYSTDGDGQNLFYQSCSGDNINSATGECFVTSPVLIQDKASLILPS